MNRTMTITEAREIAEDLIYKEELVGWTFKLDNAKRRAGQCNYTRREISLSRHLISLRSYEDTMNTITHEIAHALTPGHDHDLVWSNMHRSLGGDGRRCFTMGAIKDPNAPWVGTCGHGKTWDRYRRPKRLNTWVCKCPPGETPIVWEDQRLTKAS